MSNAPIDSDAIRTLADLLVQTGLTEIEYDNGSVRLRVAKTAPTYQATAPVMVGAPVSQAAPGTPPAIDPADHPGAVKSPMVGVIYHAPEPGAPPFIHVGDNVADGQTICLIEAMKTFNPVRAPKGGTVIAILVDDATPVEFGEPLVIIQ